MKNKNKQKLKNKNKMEPGFKRLIIAGGLSLVFLVTFLIINPFSVNDAGSRTVVQRINGEQFVQFAPGVFYAGVFAKETEWPNQISVTYQAEDPNMEFRDNGIEIGVISIMFSDRTKANVKGIAQFILPSLEAEMIALHNAHRTPESLVAKRLATYTKECLQSSSSLLSSDKHSGGGRAQMSQDFLDQLKNGVYLAEIKERNYFDSLDKETKREYLAQIKTDPKTQQPLRKVSDIAEYSITVASAAIIDTDYEDIVDKRRDKIIEANTATALSRQTLMKAQQEALTKRAEGEKDLVEIEYATKKDQTKQVVQAQTRVQVSVENKKQQQADYEAALIEVKKRQALADVAAYEKKTTIMADGALSQKLEAWKFAQEKQWEAFGKFQGNLVPQFQTGGNGSNTNALNFMEIMSMKAAKDLTLDLKIKD